MREVCAHLMHASGLRDAAHERVSRGCFLDLERRVRREAIGVIHADVIAALYERRIALAGYGSGIDDREVLLLDQSLTERVAQCAIGVDVARDDERS